MSKLALVLASFLAASFVMTPQDAGSTKQPQQKPASKPAQQTAKERKIRTLLNLTGAGDMGKQIMDTMGKQLALMPGMPEGLMAKISEIAKPQDLVNKIVPIYMRHLEEKDIDEITKFFRGPAGSRWIKAQPKISGEAMQVGQRWGQELARKAMAALRK